MAFEAKRGWRIAHSESSLGWGGQEHRILAEVNGFRRRGSTVWVMAPAASELLRRAAAAQAPVAALSVARWQFPWAVIRTAQWLRQHRVEILNTHSSRDGWLAGLAGRLARVPLILRTRHFDVPVPYPWFSRHVYATLADHVLTTSPRVSAHFRDLFRLPADRVSTVPTGIDVKRFCPEGPKAAFPPTAAQEGWPLVGMLGILRHAKGHRFLLQAARLLSEQAFPARFLIIGDGPMREIIATQVAELGLQARVSLVPHREDVPEVLRALDLLVIPSLHEGIPQTALQALACKTPVACSNVGGLPAIIQEGKTGRLFPPGDAAAIASTIRAALAEPVATRGLAQAGRALVETNHSLEGMLDTLSELYARCLPAYSERRPPNAAPSADS